LPELIPIIDGVPRDVLDASRKLAFTSAVLFNIGVNRAEVSSAATTYFYDEDVIFARINLPHLFAPSNAPPGCGAIQAEVYFSDKYKPLNVDASSLMKRVLHDLRRCDILRDDDEILMQDVVITRYANVIYDVDRAPALTTIHAFLNDIGIRYCGRYGNWDHAWTDEAFLSGEQTAKSLLGQFT
jgi:protoporphyrinogen oxidase